MGVWIGLMVQFSASTLEIAALQARPSVVASGLSQSDHDAVVCERNRFAFILCSLADHTSRLEDDFLDLVHQTRAGCLIVQRCISSLFENFRLQPDLSEATDEGGPAPIA